MIAERHKSDEMRQVFDEYLQATHRRRTQERFMVLDCAAAINGHFTADDIMARLTAGNKPVAMGTVYSTLQLLADCGLVSHLRPADGATLYECTGRSHLHLICSLCGKIKDVRDGNLETLLRSRRFTAFTPTSFALTVYGICSACARTRRRDDKKRNNSNTTISKSLKRK